MDLKLKGKKAVILGGTRGIGRAIADTLIAEGADVAVCARNADEVAAAVSTFKASGAKAFGASVDVADGEALKAWIANAAEELGGVDVLISNAGAMAQGADPASWEQNFKVDLLGMVNAFDAAKPFLLKAAETHGDAAFAIIASVAAAEADSASSYGPVKAALIHYAKGLAREYAGRKVRTNVVSPGTVYFKDGVWNRIELGAPAFFKSALERNPTGRMATPEEVAAAAVFLCSPLSAFTNGVNLLVDGAISRRVNY